MEPTPSSGAAKYVVGIIIIGIIIVAVTLVGSARVKSGFQAETPAPTTVPENPVVAPAEQPATMPSVTEVSYTDQGFVPKDTIIKLGDTVKFTNKSGEVMWVGSNEHPTHILYSGTSLRQHCPDTAGTAFDQCGKGNEYSFTFTKAGAWEYHNHSHASMGGMVTVK